MLGGLGLSVSFCLRGAGFNFLAAVLVRAPPPLLRGARWPIAGVWRDGAAPSGDVWWLVLVRPSVSVPCFGVVVCCGAPCCVVPCFAVLCRAGPCCVAVPCAGPRRVALWRAVTWGVLSWCVAPWCAAVRCAVLPRVMPWWVGGGQSGPCRGAECASECGWPVAGGCG